MRSLRFVLITAVAMGGLQTAAAACEYPAEIQVPDGAVASKDDMTAAQKQVTEYMGAMETYLACLDQEEASIPAEQQTDEQKALHVKRHNAAVDAMETVAARYNEQVRAFKTANQ